MKIDFLVNPVFDGWEPTDTRLGGTERAVVEWAEELARRGHLVRVYYNKRMHGNRPPTVYKNDGELWWHPRGDYLTTTLQGDVCINIKSSEVPPKGPTLYYTNEMNASDLDLSAYDGVIHISNYAKDNIPVNNPNVYIVPHGYDQTQIYPDKKMPKQCFYASSPDRGLQTLLEAWPKVYEAHPDATLIVTYGGTGPALPGVMYMGEVDEDFMADIYKTSDIWCHPCNGGELFCITGIKAQAAGCWPVIIPTMALQETVKYGTFSNAQDYAQDLIDALTWHPVPSPEKMPTIEDSTNELLNVIHSVIPDKANKQ